MKWEGIEERKRKETLSVRTYDMPGPVLGVFVFFLQLYTLLNRHFTLHFIDENTEFQRG